MLFKMFRSIFLIPIFYILMATFAIAESEVNDKYLDMSVGSPNASVTLIEYASFTCPHCAEFHNDVFPSLKKEYIDTNKVKFIYREVYFDAAGLWAGLLARCAEKEKYFGIVKLLYNKQKKWAFASSEKEILNELASIGRQIGINEIQFKDCLSNKDKALNLVQAYQENAKKDEITSTPSLVIENVVYKNMPYKEIKLEIEKALK